jgi:hypothetical protein
VDWFRIKEFQSKDSGIPHFRSAAVAISASMEEIRRQIKAEETSNRACHNCRKTATCKCSKCGAPYCSKACQRSHFAAHRAHCDVNEKLFSEGDRWFLKHRVEIALLARALIPPEAHLTQVLYLVVNDCIDCHRGTCTCVESSGQPPGGFHIFSASIFVRPVAHAGISEGVERTISEGFNFCEKGRMVAMCEAKNNALFVQWCYTDSYQEETYTATQLMRVINRDEKYAVPEMYRCLTPLVSLTLILALFITLTLTLNSTTGAPNPRTTASACTTAGPPLRSYDHISRKRLRNGHQPRYC